jgi:hypothetical protein
MVASSVKIWPGKHYITINKWYSTGEEVKHPRIQVMNTESYDINVSVSIDNPHVNTLSGGYSQIPDLSWVKVFPEVLYLPGGSSDFVEVFIEIPESEQSLHYNEKWEALVVFTPPIKPGGGVNVQVELAVKLFIKTPTGEVARIPYIYILLGIIISAIIIYMTQSYVNKKKSSEAIFYFKKKKRGRSKF